METTLFARTFKNGEGDIVIAQKPNPPLIAWLAAALLSLLPNPPLLQAALEAIAFGSIFTWAWMELFQGINYFRRTLGLIVLLLAIASRIDLL